MLAISTGTQVVLVESDQMHLIFQFEANAILERAYSHGYFVWKQLVFQCKNPMVKNRLW